VITILGMGQSNAQGNQSGGPDFTSSTIEVWNNHADRDDLVNIGTSWSPMTIGQPPFNIAGSNNMMAHAARWVEITTGEPVRLILVSMGGQSINKWTDAAGNRGPLYYRMLAVLAAAGITDPVDLFPWHQGEADNGTSGTYAARFAAMLSNLMADGVIDANTKIVIGETSPASANILPVLRSLASAQVKVAHLSILPTAPDGIHFTGPSLSEAGRLMAEAAGYSLPGVVDFHAINCAPKSIAASSFVKIPFPFAHWNHGGYYDEENSRFTPPAGRYLISTGFQMSGLAFGNGQLLNIAVYKNGQMFKRHYGRASGAIDGNRIEFVDYASGVDWYEVYGYGVGTPAVAAAIENTWFQATKI
jgi:hypothetical protein